MMKKKHSKVKTPKQEEMMRNMPESAPKGAKSGHTGVVHMAKVEHKHHKEMHKHHMKIAKHHEKMAKHHAKKK